MMNIGIKTIASVALVTIVTGAISISCVILNSGRTERETGVVETDLASPIVRTNKVAKVEKPVSHKVVRREKQAASQPKIKKKKGLPPVLLQALIQDAGDTDNYKGLKSLLRSVDTIVDSKVRLQLLDALSWYGETAVEDAIQFLVDQDPAVVARAAEVIEQNLSSVQDRTLRQTLFVTAITRMKDEADQDQMVALLEQERKSYVLDVMKELEGIKSQNPKLWEKVAEEYEYIFQRPYRGYMDALKRWNPGDD